MVQVDPRVGNDRLHLNGHEYRGRESGFRGHRGCSAAEAGWCGMGDNRTHAGELQEVDGDAGCALGDMRVGNLSMRHLEHRLVPACDSRKFLDCNFQNQLSLVEAKGAT